MDFSDADIVGILGAPLYSPHHPSHTQHVCVVTSASLLSKLPPGP